MEMYQVVVNHGPSTNKTEATNFLSDLKTRYAPTKTFSYALRDKSQEYDYRFSRLTMEEAEIISREANTRDGLCAKIIEDRFG